MTNRRRRDYPLRKGKKHVDLVGEIAQIFPRQGKTVLRNGETWGLRDKTGKMAKKSEKIPTELYGGAYLTLDDRCRVPIPARLLPTMRLMSGLADGEELSVAITISPLGGVAIYPIPVLDKFLAELHGAPPEEVEIAELRRSLKQAREEADVDSQGRTRIPQFLLDAAGIIIQDRKSVEVMVKGAEDHIRILSKEAGMEETKREVELARERHNKFLQSPYKRQVHAAQTRQNAGIEGGAEA